MHILSRSAAALLLSASCITSAALAAEAPLRFHYPDSGAPPYLFLTPGADRPTGIVADVLEAAAKQAGRTVHYDFQPRERAADAVKTGKVDGAVFFTVTRPAAGGVTLSTPLLRMDSTLVVPREHALNFQRPADLADQRLCTLTDEVYPPLALLAMSGKLLQRKAKTEQAQLMMLRNEDCLAAIVNGPTYLWLAARYRWDDLRIEKQPLLSEDLVLGFSPRESAFITTLNATVARLRNSGELDRIVQRHLPGAARITTR